MYLLKECAIISAFDSPCKKIFNDTTVDVSSVFLHYFVVISLKSEFNSVKRLSFM